MSLRLFDILRCIACPRSKISFFSTSPNSIYTTSIPSTTSQAKLALDVKRRKKEISPILDPSLLMAFSTTWMEKRCGQGCGSSALSAAERNVNVNVMIAEESFVKQTQGQQKTFRFEANGHAVCTQQHMISEVSFHQVNKRELMRRITSSFVGR